MGTIPLGFIGKKKTQNRHYPGTKQTTTEKSYKQPKT